MVLIESGSGLEFNVTSLVFLGTPIVRPPVLGNQDLNLHKLYNLVKDIGGMEKVYKMF